MLFSRLRLIVGPPVPWVGRLGRCGIRVDGRRLLLPFAFLYQPRGDDVLASGLPELEIFAGATLGTRPDDDAVRLVARLGRDQPRAVVGDDFRPRGQL